MRPLPSEGERNQRSLVVQTTWRQYQPNTKRLRFGAAFIDAFLTRESGSRSVRETRQSQLTDYISNIAVIKFRASPCSQIA